MKRKIFCILFSFVLVFSVCILLYNYLKKDTIAVIGAMEEEIQAVSNNLHNKKTVQNNNFKIILGTIGKYNIVLSKSGVGKVCSATTTQYIIDKYHPKYIINIGIAGGLKNNLKAGDMIIADKMVQHDFDVTAFGNPKGYIDNGFEPDKPTIFRSDKSLVEFFKNKSASLSGGRLIIGTIATGDVFVNNEAQKSEIIKEFDADATDMESAAIAQTAQRNNVPLIVLRTISDSENNTTDEYKQNKEKTADNTALMLVEFLK